MNTYLLLRSNKQSGPYTLDEIRAMQLKAYDLVWVEGKSAAWRYPGEIEELKSFSPPVEEQPFDRFFKKPAREESLSTTIVKQNSLETENHRYAPSVSVQQTVGAQNNGPVYVNLPAEKKETSPQEKDQQEYIEKKQPVKERPPMREIVYWEPIQKTFAQSLPTATQEPVVLEENFSQSLDDIKKQYAEKILRQKKNRPINIRRYAQPIAVGVIMIALLAAGIFIGLTINNRGTISTQKDVAKYQNGASDQQTVYPTKTIPISSSLPQRQADKNIENNPSAIDDAANAKPPAVTKEITNAENKKAKAARQKILDSLRAQKTIDPKPDSSAIVAQREAVHRTDIPAEKDNIKNNIEDYVSASASKYNVGTFGGISDLQVTVSNSSPYALDVVVVEVQYIQSNKKTFKTENIYFHNINAGSALMQEAPKSPRGVKVKYRITMINSKNAGISFSDI